VDFGGGTLDLSLVRLETKNIQQPLGFILKWGQKDLSKSNQKSTTARVLAKTGQNLGGSDIDNWIGDYFTTTQGLKSSPLITRLAEKLKIQLSSKNQATEVYFDDQEFESYQLDLDRDTLESILKQNDFFTRLDESMLQVLQQARRVGIETTDIDAVLLVGGTVLIPSVQTWINQYFDSSKIKSKKPFEAIAQGALQLTQGVEVQDFLYHNYGIRYWDRRNNKHNWHSIIKSGQSYPMQKPVELLLGASVENQPSMELIIGELGTDTGNTEVYFDGDRLITKLLSSEETLVKPLNDRDGARSIAQLNPAGFPGSDRIKLLFTVDEKCFLRLTVKDLLTNQTLLENQIVVQLS
jgi:molecular chaperone DnaK (HSP70)